ncbi:MAG TPA: pyrroline-5-carboxylate reductase [Candidatus Barnesiella excrementigallinarum]|nr:pyrroline-5-carboxylate reductase [Candidatus Barnesiella excrementigallinarum]
MKITIIGGGNMGGAIARGLAQSTFVIPDDITVSNRGKEKLDLLKTFNPSIHTTTDNKEAIKNADIIILAVKPWVLDSVAIDIRKALDLPRQIIVSVVAGATIERLAGLFASADALPAIVRAMPNTAIAVRQSMTLLTPYNAVPEQVDCIREMFDSVGKSLIVDESLMTAGTALCSCGTAFAMRYIRAAIEGGIEMGFYPKDAALLVEQTVKGAAELLLASGNHPEIEIDKVTTPGGITIKGLNEMEAAGFSAAVIRGLKASK